MPVEHSPNSNSSKIAGAVSNELLLATIQKNDANINRKLDSVLDRLNTLEDNQKHMETRLQALEHTNHKIVNDMQISKENADVLKKEVSQTLSQLKESQDRSWRKNNIVLMGILENEESDNTVCSLLNILLPKSNYLMSHERFGKQNESHPRLIRVYLPNRIEKQKLLANCKLLHDNVEFKGISVKPDLTKTQQEERKSRAVTRSHGQSSYQPNPNKRPRTDFTTQPSSATPMEDN